MLLSGVNSMLHSSLSLLLGVLSSVLCAIWRVVNCLMQDLLLQVQVQVQVQVQMLQMTVMKCLHYSQDSDGMLQWHKPNTNEVDPRAKRPANNSGARR
jgi:uncharacterized membrane protein YagU involved in acid resistance